MNYSEEITNKLNELLEKNYDAEAGYIEAAKNVKSTTLQNFFKERAKDRYDFGHEIKEEIKLYGGKPDKGTSIKGDAHRMWMNLKSTFSSSNEESILEEAIRGEKEAFKDYDKILNETELASTTTKILEKHRNSVLASLEKVKLEAESA